MEMKTMKYNEMKTKVFASGTIPDGYFGDRRHVDFALHNDRIYVVADCGFFWSGLTEVDTASAKWILENHPRAKHITISN